jgi:hypothetical protein
VDCVKACVYAKVLHRHHSFSDQIGSNVAASARAILDDERLLETY